MHKEIVIAPHQEESYTISSLSKPKNSITFIVHEHARLKVAVALPEIEGELHLSFILQGAHSSVECVGWFIACDERVCKLEVNQLHYGLRSKSHCLIKGVAKDTSTTRVYGKIIIDQEAQHTDGSFTHKNLVFDGAAVISEPTMEVAAHEVACNHGSAISRIDEAMLLYCQSRGLSHAAARQLIINGFLRN